MRQVHEATLIDLVYPTEIVGKRVRYRLDGSKLLKARSAFPRGLTFREMPAAACFKDVTWGVRAMPTFIKYA